MSNLFDKDWDLTEAVRILMEDIEKNSTKESMEGTMIRASIKAGLDRRQLINTKINEGLIGVYLLGMKHMYEYLEK